MPVAIDTHGLRKRFGRPTVLAGLDLSVPAGTVFALLGPNGAGKTTTINILDDARAARRGHRAASPGFDVVAAPRQVKRAHQPHRPVRRGRRGADRRGEPAA